MNTIKDVDNYDIIQYNDYRNYDPVNMQTIEGEHNLDNIPTIQIIPGNNSVNDQFDLKEEIRKNMNINEDTSNNKLNVPNDYKSEQGGSRYSMGSRYNLKAASAKESSTKHNSDVKPIQQLGVNDKEKELEIKEGENPGGAVKDDNVYYEGVTLADYEELSTEFKLKYDNRSFFKYLFDIATNENAFFNIFFKKSLYYPNWIRALRCWSYAWFIVILNAALYTDSDISARLKIDLKPAVSFNY